MRIVTRQTIASQVGRRAVNLLMVVRGAILLWLLCVCLAQAQPANTLLLGPEPTTVASTTGTNVVYEFGAGTSFNTVPLPVTYPLVATCANNAAACTAIGGDPAPGVAKSLYAVEQATPYTVTLDDGTVVTVPALAATPCALPESSPSPAAIPATPANCKLMAGAVAIATDGQMVAMQQAFAPYYIQYCQGAVCDAPQVGAISWLLVGPDTLGGPTGGTGAGTLYLIQAIPGFKLLISNTPAKTVTLPALVTTQ